MRKERRCDGRHGRGEEIFVCGWVKISEDEVFYSYRLAGIN
jgi:hypothetical protein